MVDRQDLFKKLVFGARFDIKRFKTDAETFKLAKTQKPSKSLNTSEFIEELDFFGDGDQQKNVHHTEIVGEENGELTKEESVKNAHDDKKEKKKKRKRKKAAEEADEEVDEIELMSGVKKKVVKKKLLPSKQQLIEQQIEQTNIYRKEHRIYVHGSDIPDPVRSFDDLSERFRISKAVLRNLSGGNYTEPTPIQMQAIPIVMQERELLACAPTGSGKTLAFVVPLLAKLRESKPSGIGAIVLSPTRELAQQIYREFVRMNVGVGLKVDILSKAKIKNFAQKSSKTCDILICTPNRLVHMLNSDDIDLTSVRWLVLDEGDKLFEEGEAGFRAQVGQIYQSCDHPSVKRLLFSATLANCVEDWCKNHLDNVVRVTVGARGSATDTIEQKLLFVGQESGKLLAMRQLLQKGFSPPMLVFVQSKDRAKELFNELIYDGMNVDVIHSDRTQTQRENVVKSFRLGKIWILIATELMGRGIDFKGVNVVVNYDFPPTTTSYIHRIGRTGRAGRKGEAVTMFTEDDVINLRSVANVVKSSGGEVPEWMLKLKKPDRRTKKKLEKVPLERKHINTVSKYDHDHRTKKKQIINMSKKKKDIINKEENKEEAKDL